jgi:hypothetical protein
MTPHQNRSFFFTRNDYCRSATLWRLRASDARAGPVSAIAYRSQRTATVISPIRSKAIVMTSPGFTGETPWQVPVMMISPG